MRLSLLFIVVFCGVLALVAGWDKDDYEIFRLKDEIEAHEGQDVTFYDFVGIKPGASQDEINKAYRKKSRIIHPDKAKQSFIASRAKPTSKPKAGKKSGVHVSKPPSEREIQKAVKEASDRFARLGVITNILRGEGRERYDHFLANGFPKWRGTGYYYARFRPGLFSTICGLFVFGGGLAHYGVLLLSWKRQREFVERYIRQARKAAWGDETGIMGIPGADATGGVEVPATATGQEDGGLALNRRQKRLQEREAKKGKDNKRSRSAQRSGTHTPLDVDPQAPQGQKKRVEAENGKTLLVDSVGNVYLEEEDTEGKKEQFLLDPNEIVKPTFKQTVLYRLPVWVYYKLRVRIVGHTQEDIDAGWADEDDTVSADEDDRTHLKTDSALNGASRKTRKRNGKVR
ncbi:hypothetical protein MMC17_007945 [Xylographa soralifera]|nr:hypothetical protein [Xylographa soralifera]